MHLAPHKLLCWHPAHCDTRLRRSRRSGACSVCRCSSQWYGSRPSTACSTVCRCPCLSRGLPGSRPWLHGSGTEQAAAAAAAAHPARRQRCWLLLALDWPHGKLQLRVLAIILGCQGRWGAARRLHGRQAPSWLPLAPLQQSRLREGWPLRCWAADHRSGAGRRRQHSSGALEGPWSADRYMQRCYACMWASAAGQRRGIRLDRHVGGRHHPERAIAAAEASASLRPHPLLPGSRRSHAAVAALPWPRPTAQAALPGRDSRPAAPLAPSPAPGGAGAAASSAWAAPAARPAAAVGPPGSSQPHVAWAPAAGAAHAAAQGHAGRCAGGWLAWSAVLAACCWLRDAPQIPPAVISPVQNPAPQLWVMCTRSGMPTGEHASVAASLSSPCFIRHGGAAQQRLLHTACMGQPGLACAAPAPACCCPAHRHTPAAACPTTLCACSEAALEWLGADVAVFVGDFGEETVQVRFQICGGGCRYVAVFVGDFGEEAVQVRGSGCSYSQQLAINSSQIDTWGVWQRDITAGGEQDCAQGAAALDRGCK